MPPHSYPSSPLPPSPPIGKGNAEELLKAKLLDDFYSFQKREVKKEKLNDLRIRFEADKERIARMKTNRRFMPY